jgi:hypothetical protein
MCILSINNKQHLCSNLRKIHNSAYLVCRWRCGDFNIQRAALWKKPLLNISDSSIYHWQTDSNCILKITFLAFFLLPIIDYNSKKLLVDKKKSNKIPTKKKTSSYQFSDIDRDGTPQNNASLAPATTPE